MSRWSEQLESHEIWETIDRIKAHLSAEINNSDDQVFVEKRRLSELLEQYKSVLQSMEAENVPFNRLDNLNNHFTSQVANHTEAYSTSGDLSHLQSANDQLTIQLIELGILRSLCGDIAATSQMSIINKLADEFAQNISENNSELAAEVNRLNVDQTNLRSALDDLNSNIDAKKQETDGLIAQWQSEFSQAVWTGC